MPNSFFAITPTLIVSLKAVQQELSENGFPMYRDPEPPPASAVPGRRADRRTIGVEYHLHFGSSFTGTEEEIEIGKSSKDGDAEEKAEEEKTGWTEEADGKCRREGSGRRRLGQVGDNGKSLPLRACCFQ